MIVEAENRHFFQEETTQKGKLIGLVGMIFFVFIPVCVEGDPEDSIPAELKDSYRQFILNLYNGLNFTQEQKASKRTASIRQQSPQTVSTINPGGIYQAER